MASSLDTSIFSNGPVSGASSWSKGAPPSATISGSPGIPYGGYSDYTVTVGSTPVTVTVTTTGQGSAYFLNNSYNSITLSQTTTLEVYGNSVSSNAGDIVISVFPQGNQSAVIAQVRATVISVSLTLNNSGTWNSDDLAATDTLRSQYSSNLGPNIVSGPPGSGAYCAEVIEYMGAVQPSDYKGVIALWRTKNTATFNFQTQYVTDSGPDPSVPGNEVTIPHNGHIFDADAPGQHPDYSDASSIWRARQNYIEYALLDHAPTSNTSSVALASMNVFARTSCTGPQSSPQFADDVVGDNSSGIGSTPLTWNLKPAP